MKLENKIMKRPFYTIYIICFISLAFITGCKKFVEVPLPVSGLTGEAAFTTDKSTAAVLNNMYASLSASEFFSNQNGVGYRTGIYTDELELLNANPVLVPFYSNTVQNNNTGYLWTGFYKQIYAANIIIEGTRASATLTNKNQWLGEALFMRAFLHFYLVNLYGDVAIAISSDYKANNTSSRSPQSDVYKQIITDLKEAQSLLPNDYHDGDGSVTTDKGRPNKLAATALLARAYLYTGDWANAEAQATALINNSALQLTALAQTFLANSAETIWSISPEPPAYVGDFNAYNNVPDVIPANKLISTLAYGALSKSMISTFETGDKRFTTWVRVVTTAATPISTYYLINKYRSNVSGVEYMMMLRHAEQYLIRAEARARLNNLTGAKTDLDAVRTRAGLAGTTESTQAAMLTAILHERRVEFFTESGFRLFDLRRTGNLDAVMNVAAPLKNGSWSSFRQWWPIPLTDLLSNPNLKQTPGYQ
jgi:hypothetical protein